MSRLPAVSALSMISELPMSLFSTTRKPAARKVRAYSSPRMYCSVKFFVPIVIVGSGCAFLSLPPPPPPTSAAVTAGRAGGGGRATPPPPRRRRPAPPLRRPRSGGGAALRVRSAVERCDARAPAARDRQREAECAALAGGALRPDPATVLLDDALADRKPDAGARIVLLAVEPVERLEDALGLSRVHADAIVGDREDRRVPLDLGADADDRIALGELERVADQVEEDLTELADVAEDHRQLLDGDIRIGLTDRPGQHLQCLGRDVLHLHRLVQQLTATGAGVLEQVADQGARLDGGGIDSLHELLAAVQLLSVALLEQLGVHRDRRERRLEVVRGDGGELLELAVRALQLA